MFHLIQPKKRQFSRQLSLSFAVLMFFAVLQAAMTLWVAGESDYHIEKGRVSNRILTEFIDLGGNKQRLKVWLAQYLLTNDSSVDVRNNLIFKMNTSLKNLEELLQRDLQLTSGNASETIIIREQTQRYKTLKENINKLEFEVNRIDKNKFSDPGEAWKFMIQIFDSLDGNDLRKLINDAIEIQKMRAADAETAARNYIKYFNASVYFLTGLIVIITILFAYLLQKAVKNPIENLVSAAGEFSQGNMNYRISDIPDNEFGIVATKFNEMANELEKSRKNEIRKLSEIENAVETRTQELKLAVDKLQKAEYERKIFLSNISHELKTPATAILGEASVTLRGHSQDVTAYKESLQSIQVIGRQLSNRIDDLLLLARTDSDYFRIHLTEYALTDVKPMLDEALILVDPASQTIFSIDQKIDFKKILLDRDRFVQMLSILLDNALRYNSQNEQILISISSEQTKLKIAITNSCDNIEDINFDKIFERYYRSHHARVIRPDGLGIGLHLAQTIAKAHYGLLNAEAAGAHHFRVSVEIPLKGER